MNYNNDKSNNTLSNRRDTIPAKTSKNQLKI